LGCPKNEVDSDLMSSLLERWGWQRADKAEQATLLIVNTCSFITAAVEEAIESILEICDLREEGRRKVVVAGCLVARYGASTLASLLPEVDLFLDFGDYDRLGRLADSLTGGRSAEDKPDLYRRMSSTLRQGYVFIKISEGCRRKCSYCTIPSIRGPLRSRAWEDVQEEADWFLKRSAKELVLVAQDTTSYGLDIYGKPSLPFLINRIAELDGDFKIRVMYLHPDGVDAELLECMHHPKVCPYMDLPLQHVDPDVLAAMGRGGGADVFMALIDRIRSEFEEVALRSTFMVGFPGEDQESFNRLYNFVSEARFDWLGLFRYSQEEGTPAFSFDAGVPASLAAKRLQALSELQEEIMRERASEQVGKSFRVLVEGESPEAPGYWEARSWREAPQVDGVVFIVDDVRLQPGIWCEVEISGTEGIDLIGSIKAHEKRRTDRKGER
jgi:ribosomal protein S12 methylthiotransferase